MVRIENHCVGCETCVFLYCELVDVPVYYCDICGEQIPYDEVQNMDDNDVCPTCAERRKKRKRYHIEGRTERED